MVLFKLLNCLMMAVLLFRADFGSSHATDKEYYLGLQYNSSMSKYAWGDGEILRKWNYWSSGEPSTADLCTVADPSNNWRWKSTDCSDTKYAICQYGVGK